MSYSLIFLHSPCLCGAFSVVVANSNEEVCTCRVKIVVGEVDRQYGGLCVTILWRASGKAFGMIP